MTPNQSPPDSVSAGDAVGNSTGGTSRVTDPNAFRRLKELFLELCDLNDTDQRTRLDQLSETDQRLRGELEVLLEEHRFAESIEPGDESGEKPDRFAPGGTFAPGSLIAQRYRIVARLGEGGVGSVFRADDLSIKQTVALKFLNRFRPGEVNPLARLQQEVRLAREVTHSNVCRVHDLGEVDGEPFISMEFVDGENLRSLLRRIGRLPPEKALDLAKQICLGLSAAHAKGVIHRDLKPENVMVDGAGTVRITDFGIADYADEVDGLNRYVGTPGYMAPEQFALGETSVQSDIYSLGLVLYELFTGRRVFTAESVADWAKLHASATPISPSTWVPDIDVRVERVILRCLEKRPSRRPASVISVLTALLGGDPLAAKLATGETPDPTLVASAEGYFLSQRVTATLCIAGVVSLFLCTVLGDLSSPFRQNPFEKPPAVYEETAKNLLADIAPSNASFLSTAFNFRYEHPDYLRPWLPDNPQPMHHPMTGLGRFWYQERLYPIMPDKQPWSSLDFGPAFNGAGTRIVQLDTQGKLVYFEVHFWGDIKPRDSTPSESETRETRLDRRIAKLFSAAGLDRSRFSPILHDEKENPISTDCPFVGTLADKPDEKLLVNLVSLGDQPLFFEVVPYEVAFNRRDATTSYWLKDVLPSLQAVFVVLMTVGGLGLAVANLRSGRGDWRSSLNLSFFLLGAGIFEWFALAIHHENLRFESEFFVAAVSLAVYRAVMFGVSYLAIEPEARKWSPDVEISWSRLLAGHWRDPLVSSHIIVGGVTGILITLLGSFLHYVGQFWGFELLPAPLRASMYHSVCGESVWLLLMRALTEALIGSQVILFSIALISKAMPNRATTIAVFLLIAIPFNLRGDPYLPINWLLSALEVGLAIYLMLRFGYLASLSSSFFCSVLMSVPLTLSLSSWYSYFTVSTLIILAGVLAVAYFNAFGSRSVERVSYGNAARTPISAT